MGEPVEASGNQLRAIVERIEQVEEEIKALAEAKKEIYQEAKSNGFDVKIIREVIRLRKQDPKERDELEMLLEEYWQAIKQAAPTGKKSRLTSTGAEKPAVDKEPRSFLANNLDIPS
jgi:uncharacterized protein (UPF0335 family)